VLLTPPPFNPNFGVFPLHQIAHVGVSVSRDLKLFGREIIFEAVKRKDSNKKLLGTASML